MTSFPTSSSITRPSLLDAVISLLRHTRPPLDAAPTPSVAPEWLRQYLPSPESYTSLLHRLVDTILSSLAPSTRSSYATAISTWCKFNHQLNVLLNEQLPAYPALPSRLTLWLASFSHPGSARNYLNAVKKAHRWLGYYGLDQDETITSMLTALKKHRHPALRARTALRADMLSAITRSMEATGDYDCRAIAVLAYQSMARVRSELFTLKVRDLVVAPNGHYMYINFAKRKNWPHGHSIQLL
ncbi:hypothetical protein FOZ63_022316, partial [Perkinsus olseni]